MEMDSQMSTRQMRMESTTWRPTSYSGSHQLAVKSGMPDWMVPMGLILGLVPLYQPLQGEGVGVREGQGVH